MTGLLRPVVTGLAAAALATVVKTKAEGVLQPLGEKLFPPPPAAKLELGADPGGHPENMPPSEVADRVQHLVTGDQLTDEQRQQVSGPLHWGMGLGAGLVYALLGERFPVVRAGGGSLFGVGLFAATHGSTLPLTGVQHPVAQMPKAWWVWEAGSHVVYALTLGLTHRLLNRVWDGVAARR